MKIQTEEAPLKVSLKENSPIEKALEVTVLAGRVDEALEAAYERIGKKAHLKGFRPGKIPRPVLEQYYRQDAESEAMKGLVQKSYPEAVRESGVHPIAPPEITVTGFGPAQDLTYEAVVQVPPVIEVKGYTGLKLIKEKTEATEGEIRENLKALQERMTQLVPVAEKRPARAQDVVTIDFKGFLEGKPIPGFEAKDYPAELGKGALFPEVEAGLIGMTPGEKKVTDVTYPSDWSDKTLAGKKVGLEVGLKAIKEKKPPELTDEFAKDLGNFGTLDEVKGKIREEILRGKEQSAKNNLRWQVTEHLIKENEFPVPEAMIHSELEAMVHRIEENLKTQGITPEQAGLETRDFFSKNREEAIFRVKGMLLFDAVAQKENIAVTPEEVDRRIEDMARLAGQSPEAWKKYYREKELIFQVEGALREEKTLDFVLSQSKIKIKGD